MIVAAWSSQKEPGVNKSIADWCASHIARSGLERGFPEPYTTAAVLEGDVLIGACVFHNWQPEEGTIEISAASLSPRWLPLRVQREICSYVFDQLGCQLMVMRTTPENDRLRKMLKRFGFREFEIPRLLGRDKSQIVLTLADDDWRESRFCEQKEVGDCLPTGGVS